MVHKPMKPISADSRSETKRVQRLFILAVNRRRSSSQALHLLQATAIILHGPTDHESLDDFTCCCAAAKPRTSCRPRDEVKMVGSLTKYSVDSDATTYQVGPEAYASRVTRARMELAEGLSPMADVRFDSSRAAPGGVES